MNIRDLRYLLAVAQTKNFHKAAEQCFVSQPTLSMQIKKLEETLGVPLLERNTRRVILTSAGEQIIERVQKIIADIDALVDFAKGCDDPLAGSLRLGIIPTIAPYLLPRLMSPCKKSLPNLSIRVHEDITLNTLKALKAGTIDAAILATEEYDPTLSQVLLYEEPFAVVVPKQHEISRLKHVALDALHDYPVLLLDDGHCMRDQTLDICQRFSAKEVPNFKAASLETLRYMVATGEGITFLPMLATNGAFAQSAAKETKTIPIQGKAPSRGIRLYWRKNTSREAVLTAFAELVQAIIPPLLLPKTSPAR